MTIPNKSRTRIDPISVLPARRCEFCPRRLAIGKTTAGVPVCATCARRHGLWISLVSSSRPAPRGNVVRSSPLRLVGSCTQDRPEPPKAA